MTDPKPEFKTTDATGLMLLEAFDKIIEIAVKEHGAKTLGYYTNLGVAAMMCAKMAETLGLMALKANEIIKNERLH